MDTGERWFRCGPGEPEPVPEAQRQAVKRVRGDTGIEILGLRSGDLCIQRVYEFHCFDADGQGRTLTSLGTGVYAYLDGRTFWPLPGGSVLVSTSQGLMRFDPSDMTLDAYAPQTTVYHLSTGHDGRVYGHWSDGPGMSRLKFGEFTDAGIVTLIDRLESDQVVVPHAMGYLIRDSGGWRLQWP